MRQRSGACATSMGPWFRTRWPPAIWSVFPTKGADRMPSTFQLLLDGTPADETLIAQMTMLEVEENVDLPGAIQMSLPVNATDANDLTFVNDSGFKPFANLSVVAAVEGKPDECIFDGFVLSHKLHLETGTTGSTLQVWGQ